MALRAACSGLKIKESKQKNKRPVDMPSGTPPVFRDGQGISLRWFGGQLSSGEPVGILMMMDEVQDMIARLYRRHMAGIDFSPDLVKLTYNVMDGHAGAVEAVSITILESYASQWIPYPS